MHLNVSVLVFNCNHLKDPDCYCFSSFSVSGSARCGPPCWVRSGEWWRVLFCWDACPWAGFLSAHCGCSLAFAWWPVWVKFSVVPGRCTQFPVVPLQLSPFAAIHVPLPTVVILSILEVTSALVRRTSVCVWPHPDTLFVACIIRKLQRIYFILKISVSCKLNISVAMYVLVFFVNTGSLGILLPAWGDGPLGFTGLCVWDLSSPSVAVPLQRAMEWPAVSCLCCCPWAFLLRQPGLGRDPTQRHECGPSSLLLPHQLLEGRD